MLWTTVGAPPVYEPELPPAMDTYSYLGAVFVRGSDRPLDLYERVLAMANLPPKTSLKVRSPRRARTLSPASSLGVFIAHTVRVSVDVCRIREDPGARVGRRTLTLCVCVCVCVCVSVCVSPSQIWEEITHQQVDEVKPKRTFTEAELATGDIVVFQVVRRPPP
jgi:uncharacterized paraquat-inducible protein A